MMFQIKALPAELFEPLFGLSDADLAIRGAQRMPVTDRPGFPCRVTLKDAEIGENVLLLNYAHQPHDTPYRSAHAIFVTEGARDYHPEPEEIPEAIMRRVISLRAFDADHMMCDAALAQGDEIAPQIMRLLEKPETEYLQLHYALRGCYAAEVRRA